MAVIIPFSRMGFVVGMVLGVCSVASGVSVMFGLDEAPTLHTTGLELTMRLKKPLAEKIVIDTKTLNQNVFRAQVPVKGRETVQVTLRPEDFRFDRLEDPKVNRYPGLVWIIISGLEVTQDGKSDAGIVDVKAKFTGNNGIVYPWEKDPKPIGTEGGMTWWPGVDHNNAGHFGWMYEPNGLLINNVSFDRIERSWYYFKPARKGLVGKNIHGLNLRESFQFNFGIPGSLQPKPKVVVKEKEDADGKAGMKFRFHYESDKGMYENDKVTSDWTSFRWKRAVQTKEGKTYNQELRYSILAVGIQVETDSPAFEVSFQDAKTTRGPAAVIVPTAEGKALLAAPAALDPKLMVENWIVLLHHDGSPEIPTMVVFQHRPDRLEFKKESLVIHRAKGVGTIAIGTPMGATVQDAETLAAWSKDVTKIPVKRFEKIAGLLAAYPWQCRERFAVKDGWVHIRDEMSFLPWNDEWGTKPTPYAPLPPFVSYSIVYGTLPKESVHDVTDLDIITKWGPYWARKGSQIDYKLPVPQMWDHMTLDIKPTTQEDQWLHDVVTRSMRREAIEKNWGSLDDPKNIGPRGWAHCAVFDMSSAGWRAANFMKPEDRKRFRELTSKSLLCGLYPQCYAYRKDPLSGEQHMVCFNDAVEPYAVNGENAWDNTYWAGLTLYGIYTQTKYAAMWDTVGKHWPVVRSLLSYWESMHSWGMMAAGARESGLYYGADMCAAGYAGMVGFRYMAERLGTPYQRDLATYLISMHAVPRVAVFSFIDWTKKISHQEPGTIVGGYGELYVSSQRIALSNDVTDMSYNDPWWCSGLLGPCGPMPELMDLFVKRDPQRCIQWEKLFIAQCPDKGFRKIRQDVMMEHPMFRTYLGDEELRRSARDLVYQGASEYMMRHIHTVAIMLNWDVPVRLLDWAPGYISSGKWDAQSRSAQIGIEAENQPAKLTVAVHSPGAKVTLDGQDIPAPAVDRWEDWTVVAIDIPTGTHRVALKPTNK